MKPRRLGLVAGALAIGLAIAACRTTALRPAGDQVARGRFLFHEGNFGAPYQTAIPYALYLGMMERYPALLARDWGDFSARYGVLPPGNSQGGLPVGFVLRPDALSGTPFLMTNCALCHQGEIAGRRIEGIGNRRVRLNAMDNATMVVARQPDFSAETMLPAARRAAGQHDLPWSWRSDLVTRIAIKKLKEIAARHQDLESGPGRNTPIEFAKVACGVPVQPPYGYVKIPAVWMYQKRASFGYDASLQGDKAMMIASVEFNKGMPPATILAQPNTWEDLYRYLQTLEAPRFPLPVDATLVAAGRQIFVDTCVRCHGGGERAYREKVVPLDEIGTDPDRVNAVTAGLVSAHNRTGLEPGNRLVKTDGYVPPPLDGIWARAPYLHNGSVPTLVDLLCDPEQRPRKFALTADYDLQRIGLAQAAAEGPVFDANLRGNDNRGHDYATDLNEAEKRALLEYLKTL